jgi:ribose 5-phosphate isomerase RpiB
MIVTARQLEDLHKSHGGNGRVTLPYRARLTPLAADYVRARKLVLGYADIADSKSAIAAPATGNEGSSKVDAGGESGAAKPQAASFLWWCDGPCGPAKAAIVAEEKQSALRPLDKPQDAKQIVSAIKALATEVKSSRAAGGILLVQTAALATVYANRCPSLRAVLGTCMEAVEQGVQQIAANVLIIEHPYKTLQQMRNMLSRFLRGPRTVNEDVRRQLQELATCG